jgi:hypothetical protein
MSSYNYSSSIHQVIRETAETLTGNPGKVIIPKYARRGKREEEQNCGGYFRFFGSKA